MLTSVLWKGTHTCVFPVSYHMMVLGVTWIMIKASDRMVPLDYKLSKAQLTTKGGGWNSPRHKSFNKALKHSNWMDDKIRSLQDSEGGLKNIVHWWSEPWGGI